MEKVLRSEVSAPRANGNASHSLDVNVIKQRYDVLSSLMGQMMAICGPQGEWLEAQPEWEVFTGQSNYQGYAWTDAIHADDLAPHSQAMETGRYHF
jgi:hypothetical protein